MTAFERGYMDKMTCAGLNKTAAIAGNKLFSRITTLPIRDLTRLSPSAAAARSTGVYAGDPHATDALIEHVRSARAEAASLAERAAPQDGLWPALNHLSYKQPGSVLNAARAKSVYDANPDSMRVFESFLTKQRQLAHPPQPNPALAWLSRLLSGIK